MLYCLLLNITTIHPQNPDLFVIASNSHFETGVICQQGGWRL